MITPVQICVQERKKSRGKTKSDVLCGEVSRMREKEIERSEWVM